MNDEGLTQASLYMLNACEKDHVENDEALPTNIPLPSRENVVSPALAYDVGSSTAVRGANNSKPFDKFIEEDSPEGRKRPWLKRDPQ